MKPPKPKPIRGCEEAYTLHRENEILRRALLVPLKKRKARRS